nr:hypothetical protein [Gemmatimonadales bacterium]
VGHGYTARARDRGHTHSAASFTEQAMDAEHHASVIRNALQTQPPPMLVEDGVA